MAEKAVEPFDKFLANLKDSSISLAKMGLQRLSDLPKDEQVELAGLWPKVDLQRRRRVVAALVELSEENFEFDFTTVLYVFLDDPDAEVRKEAVEGLWESVDYKTADRLVELLRKDPSEEVRAEAASSLSRFTYLIEMGKLDKTTSRRVHDALLATYNSRSEPIPVRKRALEAIGYLPDENISSLISEAYRSDDDRMKVSSLLAMGRSCDPQWLDIIIDEMKSSDPEMRFEAARAAGELEDQRAVPDVEKLIVDEDREVRYAAIAALGEIGGQRAKRVLRACSQSDDPDMRQAAEEALDEMEFFEEPLKMPFGMSGPLPGPKHVH